MAVIAPTPIDAGPVVPSSADSETTFDAAYEAFNAWEKNKLQPQANALATNVYNNAQEAVAAATTATTKAGEATTAATTATTKAGDASTSASAAESAKIAAEAAFDAFDDRYLGQKPANPATDNDGGALVIGALYFRTTAPIGMKVWTGTAWDDAYANLGSKFDKTGGDVNGDINLVDSAATGGNSIRWVDSNGYVANISQYSSAHATLAGVMTINNAGGYLWSSYGIERLRIDGSGNVLVKSGALGYGVGAGGTAQQTTSRTAGVALNKPSGTIKLASAAGTTTWQSFTLTNSFIAENDSPIVVQKSGADLYEIHVTNVAAGSCRISFRTTGGTTTEQPVFKFEVFKGAAS